MIAEKNPSVNKAVVKLMEISEDEAARMLYEAREKERRDSVARRRYAEEKGMKRGQELGEKIGIEIGEKIGIEIGIEIGEKIGEERGELLKEVALVRKKLDKHLDSVAISDMLEMDVETVEKIIGLIHSYPDDTDSALVTKLPLL